MRMCGRKIALAVAEAACGSGIGREETRPGLARSSRCFKCVGAQASLSMLGIAVHRSGGLQ